MGFRVREVDRGLAALRKSLAPLKGGGSYVKAGIVGSPASAPAGDEPGISLAHLAAVHEFGATIEQKHGTVVIPERSFIRSTWDRRRGAYVALLARLLRGVYAGKVDVRTVLNLVGMQMAADQKATIHAGVSPPNAPSTLRAKLRKGRWNSGGKAQKAGQGPKPLVDTGQLVNSITHEVVFRDVRTPTPKGVNRK